jgi:hypothetical protein
LTRHQQPASRATKGDFHREERLGDSVLLTMEGWASQEVQGQIADNTDGRRSKPDDGKAQRGADK